MKKLKQFDVKIKRIRGINMDYLTNEIKIKELKSAMFDNLKQTLKKSFPEVVKKGSQVSNTDLMAFAAFVIGFLGLKEEGGDN